MGVCAGGYAPGPGPAAASHVMAHALGVVHQASFLVVLCSRLETAIKTKKKKQTNKKHFRRG